MTQPKKVLIVAPGGRGDFGPYHGMGVRLAKAGHQVGIVAFEQWRDMIESAGMEFHPVVGDAKESQASEDMTRWQESGSGVKSAVQGTKVLRGYAATVHHTAQDILAAAKKGADVMIPSMFGAVGFHVAEALGMPAIPAFVGPTEPTREFPPLGVGLGRSIGGWGNKALYEVLGVVSHLASKGSINKLRAELGLGPVKRKYDSTGANVYYGYSPELLPRPKDWPEHVKVVGYWWPAPAEYWQPSAELTDFLAAGPPPVFISFGSMSGEGRGELLSGIVTEALRKAGLRGIVQAGWAGLSTDSEDVLTVSGELDYNWLLPQAAAAVHHGGAGTTGAVTRSGVPQVVVPMIADAHFWGNQVTKVGLSPGAVSFEKLTADLLGDALHAAVSNPAYRERAGEVAAKVAEEDGSGRIIEAVEQVG
ncbi:glycosyltransferase [Amycolatopsis sp. CA-230715]|uniref:glycosyltransferase n=1 Tax=Amycolatopsis sp. CA-230715 TaxID=2745196 RepID=UPI001C0376F9|nr:glycosyltransferase [Amycolatopsis sp. CA-230715]QWF78554.1 O-mycaminosyltylonolide 6-deoxyallosyltransferase [Amycolatopsis sp. CA-230715]